MDLPSCQSDSQCGCGLTCIDEPLLGGQICEFDCQQTSDCTSLSEVCQLGTCRQNFCGGSGSSNGKYDGPCSIDDAGDGFCYPFYEGRETQGICELSGTAAIGANCAFNPVRGSPTSQLCGTSALCQGTCSAACDPLDFDSCGPGMLCSAFGGQNSPHLGVCKAGQVYDGGFAAPNLPAPLLPNNGGAVIAKPKVVTLSFAGYQDGGFPISTYADWIVGSTWLKTVGADYGVGLGTHIKDFVFPSRAPAQVTDSQIQGVLAAWVADGGIPAPDSDTIYLIYYPASTTITMSGSVGCQGFGGYHEQFELPNHVPVTYGVVATCAQQTGLTTAQGVDVTTSHELVEAATDPDPEGFFGNPGYRFNDLTLAWSYTFSEAADLCVGSIGTYDQGFIAQRIWSNSAVRAGSTSPCVPVPNGEIYINASALPNGTQFVPTSTSAQTVTYQITPWSLTPTTDWFLIASAMAGSFTPGISLTGGTAIASDVVQVNNGDAVTLQVTIPPGTPSGSIVGIQLASDPNQSLLNYTLWPVAIFVE